MCLVPPKRFYSLDVLRGLAALSVVFWHWQFLAFHELDPGSEVMEQLPFYASLFLFYERGWLAVDLFFVLSGFVFHWLYSQDISARVLSGRNFFVLRFSRLYPLHLLTLLAVAGGQATVYAIRGSHYQYPWNDLVHFFMNLGLISSWGFENGYSFNGPVWSISVEVFLYLSFFAVYRVFRPRWLMLGVVALMGFVYANYFYAPLGRGVGAFYLGGCAYLAYRRTLESEHVRSIANGAVGAMSVGWLMAILIVRSGWHKQVEWFSWQSTTLSLLPIVALFPLTIYALALTETTRGSLGQRVAFLGDISYSVYLIHFPLLLFFLIAGTYFGVMSSVYYSAGTLLLFLGCLLVLSLVSFHGFERPVQNFIRLWWLSPAQGPVAHGRVASDSGASRSGKNNV
jgi:peptidoglycan/LPS O-acetylase OafA/YrhL